MSLFSDLYESAGEIINYILIGTKKVKIGFIPVLKDSVLSGISFKYGSKVIDRKSELFINESLIKKLIAKNSHIITVHDMTYETQIEFLGKAGSGFFFIGQHAIQRAIGRFLNSFDNKTANSTFSVKPTAYGNKKTHDALLAHRQTELYSKPLELSDKQFITLLKTAMLKLQSNNFHPIKKEFHAVGKRIIDGEEIYYPLLFKKMISISTNSQIKFLPNDYYLSTVLPVISKNNQGKRSDDESGYISPYEKEIDKDFAIRGYFQFLSESKINTSDIEIIDLGEI